MAEHPIKFAFKNIFRGAFDSLFGRFFKPKALPIKKEDVRQTNCVVLRGYGGYKKIIADVRDVTPPGAGQVLLAVKAGGLNFSDLYVRHGLFRGGNLPKPPFVMGIEASGQIEEVGNGVKDFKVGDRVVCLSNKTGLWTEFVSVNASDCIVIPDNMTFEDAAAFYINYLSAYLPIFCFGNLRPNQRIFIQSLAGGVGWAATQLAKTVPGVTVLGTASPWKFEAVKGNGADFPISASEEKYVEVVLENFVGGVDVVLDNRSGADFHKQRKMLRPMGTIIHLGMNNALKGEYRSYTQLVKTWWAMKSIPIFELIMSNQGVCGFNLDTVKEKHPDLFKDAVKELNALYTKGLIKPRIDSTWTFENAGKATEHLTSRKNIGKIILKAQH